MVHCLKEGCQVAFLEVDGNGEAIPWNETQYLFELIKTGIEFVGVAFVWQVTESGGNAIMIQSVDSI